jgi:hypothetical protein
MPTLKAKAAAVLGGALGLLSALLSLMTSAGGDGWNSALPFGLLSAALFPLAFMLYATRGGKVGLIVLTTLAIALDMALIARTFHEGVHHLLAVFPFSLAWIALWILWQVAVLAALVRRHPGA